MNKYRAKGLQTPDGYFPSQGQYRRWLDLKLLQRAGEISDLERGKRIPLDVNGIFVGHYTPDYAYKEKQGAVICPVIEDFKSPATMTEAAKLRIRLYEACYGAKVRITERGKRR